MPRWLQWTAPGRALVFVLSAMSIWCLLAEMYGLCAMRTFAWFILVPATVLLYGLAVVDRFSGDRRLWRAVVMGSLGGLVGAVAYDVFRLPFVYAQAWSLTSFVPQMPLFKVFPRFGALLLGEPVEQPSYSLTAQLLGWAYHFSNGATFGVMFAALADGAHAAFTSPRRFRWSYVGWATLMAAGIEAGLLISPYARFFAIHRSARFVIITLVAHLIFGVGLGLYYAWHSRRWSLMLPSAATVPAQ